MTLSESEFDSQTLFLTICARSNHSESESGSETESTGLVIRGNGPEEKAGVEVRVVVVMPRLRLQIRGSDITTPIPTPTLNSYS